MTHRWGYIANQQTINNLAQILILRAADRITWDRPHRAPRWTTHTITRSKINP